MKEGEALLQFLCECRLEMNAWSERDAQLENWEWAIDAYAYRAYIDIYIFARNTFRKRNKRYTFFLCAPCAYICVCLGIEKGMASLHRRYIQFQYPFSRTWENNMYECTHNIYGHTYICCCYNFFFFEKNGNSGDENKKREILEQWQWQ